MSDSSKSTRRDTRRRSASSPWVAGVMGPCDPEIFRQAVDAWGAAQQVPLRTEPAMIPGYALADIPVNRAGVGALKFLRERSVPDRQAHLARLMHMGEVFENAAAGGGLAKFVKPSEDAGSVLVSDALLHAVALAPITMPADRATATGMLDIETIRAIADETFSAAREFDRNDSATSKQAAGCDGR